MRRKEGREGRRKKEEGRRGEGEGEGRKLWTRISWTSGLLCVSGPFLTLNDAFSAPYAGADQKRPDVQKKIVSSIKLHPPPLGKVSTLRIFY